MFEHGFVAPSRLGAFLEYAPRMSPCTRGRVLRGIALLAGWPTAPLLAAFGATPSVRVMRPPERAALAALPERIRVFRGSFREEPHRASWSPDRSTAALFAFDLAPESAARTARVWSGTVARADVLALFETRGLQELVVDPATVVDIAVEDAAPLHAEATEAAAIYRAAMDRRAALAAWRRDAGRDAWGPWWRCVADRLCGRGWVRSLAEVAAELGCYAHFRLADPEPTPAWIQDRARTTLRELATLSGAALPAPPTLNPSTWSSRPR